MPATRSSTGAPQPTHSRARDPVRTVLVADDSQTVLRLIGRTLRDAGYDVVLANDGRKAVQQALEQQPDLIVLDINMPELDGYGVCQELLASPNWDAQTPVIFLTSAEAPFLTTLGSHLGAFLSKPTESHVLLDCVAALLGRSRPSTRRVACNVSGQYR
ncbi:response regulator [Stieleria sp. TO1_6]|uniref:response regulator n=1 Tax=Stieleria tagensis TaxID=2956795 RepID=UPI00209BA0EB|nr:response regulator [Stieleria tagensis]MCO8124665.1 response regulator [Stieleria tagensis]